MKSKLFLVFVVILIFLLTLQVGGADNVTTLFPSSLKLQDQYGVCSHITMLGSRWNYPTHEKELEILKKNNIEWVRSDLVVDKIMPIPDQWTPKLFDEVFRNVKHHNRKFFPIICSSFRNQYAWEGDWYDKYIQYVLKRYGRDFDYWEVMNEVDLILKNNPNRNVAQGYLNCLKKTYSALKEQNPNAKVLSTSFCDMDLSLLDYLCENKGYNYFDIFNFHSYAAPEALPFQFSLVKDRMDKYGWKCPVWMTECGFSTVKIRDELTNKDFFSDFLPAAIRQIGMEIKNTNIAVLADLGASYTAMTQDEVDLYLKNQCKSVRYVSFGDIQGLTISSYPIMIVSEGETFPLKYFDLVLDYVRRGGTIVLAGGAPFYFDMRNVTQSGYEKYQVGDTYYAKLHMSALFWWSAKAKQLKVPEIPSYTKNLYSKYSWTFSAKNSSRFLSKDNLHPGDRLIPMIEAGDDNFKGCVAGIYDLNSDLKGNIIFQTRLGCVSPSTEEEQARRVPRIHLIAFANGVEKVFMYNLRSSELDLYDKECHFGLLHSDLSEKPAFHSYCTLIKMCPSGSTRPTLTYNNGIYLVNWIRPDGKYVTCLWTSFSKKMIKLNLKKDMELFNFKGTKVKYADDTIQISPEVLYIVSSKSLDSKILD